LKHDQLATIFQRFGWATVRNGSPKFTAAGLRASRGHDSSTRFFTVGSSHALPFDSAVDVVECDGGRITERYVSFHERFTRLASIGSALVRQHLLVVFGDIDSTRPLHVWRGPSMMVRRYAYFEPLLPPSAREGGLGGNELTFPWAHDDRRRTT
jgi:hypothetical protein